MSTLVYVTVETSPVGENVIGVFSSLARARDMLRLIDAARLPEYRIELHVLDEPPTPSTPWLVVMARDGSGCDVSRFIGCAACDEVRLMADASFIERGGERMRVVVWAGTPGQALAAANAVRRRLIEDGVWGTEYVSLEPLRAPGAQPSSS